MRRAKTWDHVFNRQRRYWHRRGCTRSILEACNRARWHGTFCKVGVLVNTHTAINLQHYLVRDGIFFMWCRLRICCETWGSDVDDNYLCAFCLLGLTPCSLINIYQSFGGSCFFRMDEKVHSSFNAKVGTPLYTRHYYARCNIRISWHASPLVILFFCTCCIFSTFNVRPPITQTWRCT